MSDKCAAQKPRTRKILVNARMSQALLMLNEAAAEREKDPVSFVKSRREMDGRILWDERRMNECWGVVWFGFVPLSLSLFLQSVPLPA